VKAMMGSIEAPIVANQTLAAVSAIFSWALKEEILPANPCKLVQRNATRSRERAAMRTICRKLQIERATPHDLASVSSALPLSVLPP
jgi:hypothetical protein